MSLAPKNGVPDEDVGAPGTVAGAERVADEDVGAAGDAAACSAQRFRHWHCRGYLPHLDSPQTLQSITFRLADSLPRAKLLQLETELGELDGAQRSRLTRERVDAWLDQGMGCCVLQDTRVARYVQDSLLHFHEERYQLHAWCVMPNHVHVLVEPMVSMASIVQGWKSFTARWILRHATSLGLRVPEPGRVWMRDYWDRYVRNQRHYDAVVDYIHRNPVKAGLCETPSAWRWSSASLWAVGDGGDADGYFG